jgi:hypothetical protein
MTNIVHTLKANTNHKVYFVSDNTSLKDIQNISRESDQTLGGSNQVILSK